MLCRKSILVLSAAAFAVLISAAAVFADTSDVKKTVLDNGLTVIMKEIHTAPVVSLSVWYRVGSRNEGTGITGISHALEHMAFKGSKQLPTGEADQIIRRLGGSGNAGTSMDYTVYYEVLPAGKLDSAIDIEADRMANLLLRDEDFATERNVIVEERKMRYEDSPTGLFMEEVEAAAIKVHPYRAPVIGWMSDIQSFPMDAMRAYYKSHYAPNNAIVVVTGDFDPAKVLEKVRSSFGTIPRFDGLPKMSIVEPEQKVEKRVFYRSDKTDLANVVYVYHAPSISHEDAPALEVAAALLSSGRESRMYKAFIEAGLAGSADATMDTNQDAYLFYFQVEVQPGVDTAQIEKKLDDVIDRLKTEKPSDYELQRARNRFQADEVFANESISMYGRKLGWFELAAGSYSYLDKYLSLIDRVTPEDVLRVANKYFIPTNRTVGVLVPAETNKSELYNGAPAGSRSSTAGTSRHGREFGYVQSDRQLSKSDTDIQQKISAGGDSQKIKFSEHVRRTVLPNGITLLVYENPAFPTVHVRGTIRGAGSYGDPAGKGGLAQLTARTLRRGTKTKSYEDINKALEFVGAEMSFTSGNETAVFSGKYLKKDFETGFGLLADVLMNPSFPNSGVEIERAVAVSDIVDLENSNRYKASQAFQQMMYPNHPYGNPAAGTRDGLTSVAVEDLMKFHATAYRPDRTIIVLAGDINVRVVVALAEKVFGSWKAPDKSAFKPPAVQPIKGENKKLFPMPEKTQDVFVYGFNTLLPKDPDYETFNMATDIMAGGDLTSRFYTAIREKEGLVYYVYGYHLPKSGDATFQVIGGLAPQNVARALELVRSEIRRIQTEPVSDTELADAKSYATGQMLLSLETNEDVASMLADLEYYGRPVGEIDKYPETVAKITAADIMRVAKKQLSADDFAVGIAGPDPDGKK